MVDHWVPVAEYRPDSSALLTGSMPTSLEVTEQLEVPDHIGALVLDENEAPAGRPRGARVRFYAWTPGRAAGPAPGLNPDH